MRACLLMIREGIGKYEREVEEVVATCLRNKRSTLLIQFHARDVSRPNRGSYKAANNAP